MALLLSTGKGLSSASLCVRMCYVLCLFSTHCCIVSDLGAKDNRALLTVPDEVFEWIVKRRWLVSCNDSGEGWAAWVQVVTRHPQLRLLASVCISQIGQLSQSRAKLVHLLCVLGGSAPRFSACLWGRRAMPTTAGRGVQGTAWAAAGASVVSGAASQAVRLL